MLDELKIRYKEMSFRKRLVFCVLLSLIPAAYVYLDESANLDEEYEQADAAEKAAAAQLLRADNQLKNLQKTENELEFAKEQLKKAEARLPDSILIDEILRTTGKLARESAVKVLFFEPNAPIIKGDEYKYVEVPLKISVEAPEYSQICEWLDSIAGLKTKIYLKSWVVTRRMIIPPVPDGAPVVDPNLLATSTPSMRDELEGRISRKNVRVTLAGEFSLYKLASAEELANLREAADAAAKGGASGKPGDSPKPQAPVGLKQGATNPSSESPERIDAKGGAA